MRRAPVALTLLLTAAILCDPGLPAAARDGWNPFDPPEATRPRPEANIDRGSPTPRDGGSRPGGGAVTREPLVPLAPVERAELAPVMAADGSGLPYELWRGLDVTKLEGLLARIEIPPRSPALHALWRRLVTASVTPPSGGDADRHFEALRLEALYRSGLLREISETLSRQGSGSDPVAALMLARSDVGLGHNEKACTAIKAARGLVGNVPKPLKAEAILLSGYCAAIAGDRAAAGLAADIARNEGLDSSVGLAALDAFAFGAKATVPASGRIGLLDYRILEATGSADPKALVSRGAPALLAAVALGGGDANARLAAGEAAARLNAIAADDLADIYRAQVTPAGGGNDHALRRAELFKAAEAERTPAKKVRLIRSFLDEARRADLYGPALSVMAKIAGTIPPAPEIGWFAETGIEMGLAAGDYDLVRIWAATGASFDRSGGRLDHWLALADIASGASGPGREASLASLQDLALRGRFSPELLHRLATVLDALDYNVPIPLWEAAGRTPQPNSGHLPETGVLSELQQASKNREFGRTVLLVMATIGPNGADGAHMLALGDAIRALKRAGLEPDARRLGFEALFAAWPRTAHN